MKVVIAVRFFILDGCLLPNLLETVRKTFYEEFQSSSQLLTSRKVNLRVIPIQLTSGEANIQHMLMFDHLLFVSHKLTIRLWITYFIQLHLMNIQSSCNWYKLNIVSYKRRWKKSPFNQLLLNHNSAFPNFLSPDMLLVDKSPDKLTMVFVKES